MSGHSKWATIHRQKEVKDAKRGAIFTKMAAAIAVAVREGGRIGDPDKNFRLRIVIDKARQSNMPKENITRAIEKGMGVAGEADLEEIMYEGFLPAGCAVMVSAVTDNKARTAQQIRSFLEKHGGTMAGAGAVGYLFKSVGEIRVKEMDIAKKSLEDQELEMIDLGVEDVEQEGGDILIYCQRDNTWNIRSRLENLGYQIDGTELIMKPDSLVEVADKSTQEKIEEILQGLEDLDDVTHVFTNYQPG
jgi:YebC/PmpR family DNA-binding regulatory protein